MDFFTIQTKELKSGAIEIYPNFKVGDRKISWSEVTRSMQSGTKIAGCGQRTSTTFNVS
jgi:hypothetical protein